MLYLTQLIYLKEGQEAVFDEFEAVALPLIPKYNGELLLRLRPDPADFIEASMHMKSTPSAFHPKSIFWRSCATRSGSSSSI